MLRELSGPCVLDAGAFCALKAMPGIVRKVPPRAIITPHAGEMMAFLMDVSRNDVLRDPDRFAREAADRFGVVAVCKGETTFIAASFEECYVYRGGNAGLATSGSGDTLAGIMGALLARGASPLSAALWGVAAHAQAGDALEQPIGIGFLAREICDELPKLLN